ncbi:MAG: CRISPR-associated endonuclease Cas1 [Gammaproteobacteria bacterium]
MLDTSVSDDSISAILEDIFTREPDNPSVLTTHGFGIRVSVRNGQLEIKDGVADYERIRKFPKVDRTLQRIIVTNTSGYISLDAFQWCAEHGISIAIMNPNAELVSSYTAEPECNPSVLRNQVYAAGTGKELAIIREIETRKLSGQSRNALTLFNDLATAAKINRYIDQLSDHESIQDIRDLIEAMAARDYFAAWSGRVCLEWDRKSFPRVPANWLGSFQSRSTLTSRGRHRQNASDPVNAMLNYAYTLGYHESRIACIACGLNPAIGYLHYRDGRDSLALDLLEVLRPVIDAYVIDLIRSREWSHRLFAEPYGFVPGTCRLVAPLTHTIAEASYAWREPAVDMAKTVLSILTGSDGRRGDHMSNVLREKLEFTSVAVTAEDVLADKQWASIAPLVPDTRVRRDGRPPIPDRTVIAAMVHLERHGKPYAYVPKSFGIGPKGMQDRRTKWKRSGHWDDIQAKIRELAAN